MRLTTNGKPFTPKDGEPGSLGTFTYEGRKITAQVWSAAPAQPANGTYGRRVRAFWLVEDGVAYLVNIHGVVCKVWRTRREGAVAA